MPIQPVNEAFVTVGELKLHYVQWGEQGSPIVCIHGLTANAFYFQAIAENLARDHRVFAYDLRGRGESDQPEHGYSVPIHANDLARLIDVLALEQPVILGHSLGALIALYFAAHFPDKLSKLILGDGGAPLRWKNAADQPAWLATAINRLGVTVPSTEEYIQRQKAAPYLGPYWNEYIENYFQHDMRQQDDGSVIARCYLGGIIEEGQHYNEALPAEQWAHVQVPTLIVRAGQGLFFTDDQLLTEEDAATIHQNIADSQLVNFPTLNHYTLFFNIEQGPLEAVRAFVA
jgi:Predicted hydrolases or acyltransferases (alpha/beta hydrolase superfamily)